MQRRGVVVRHAKKVLPTAIASEDQRGEGVHAQARFFQDHALQVFIRRAAVAQLKLQGLADPRLGADGQRPARGVGGDQIAHHEIARLEFMDVFRHGEAGEKIAGGVGAVRGGKSFEGFREPFEGGAGPKRGYDVLFRTSDRERFTDRAASLTTMVCTRTPP